METVKECDSSCVANATPENVVATNVMIDKDDDKKEESLKERIANRHKMIEAISNDTYKNVIAEYDLTPDEQNINNLEPGFISHEVVNPVKKVIDSNTNFDYDNWRAEVRKRGEERRVRQALEDRETDHKTTAVHYSNKVIDNQEDEFLAWWQKHGSLTQPLKTNRRSKSLEELENN